MRGSAVGVVDCGVHTITGFWFRFLAKAIHSCDFHPAGSVNLNGVDKICYFREHVLLLMKDKTNIEGQLDSPI